MLAFYLAFLFQTSFASLPYLDQDFGCFEQGTADRYVREFSVNVQSFGGMELCSPQKDTKKLFNDLSLIESATFEAAPQHKFIRGYVDRNAYYSWMKEQTYGVRRGHDIPYATAYNSGGYFTMQDGWSALSTLGRVGTIIHEARHTEGYRHYSCTTGPYAGSGVSGCDTSYSQGGSHAVEMEYYARVVLESKNLHPVYQSMARLMALGRSNFVFNQQPMQKREALLGRDGQKLILVDGASVLERQAPEVEEGSMLKRTSFGASLVKGTKSVALDLSVPAVGAALSDDYSYYKLFQSERDNTPTTVADTEELDIGNLRYFTAMDSNGSLYSYYFAQGEWYSASAPLRGATRLVTRNPQGEAGLFALTDRGDYYSFNLQNRRFGSSLGQWPQDVHAFAKAGSALVSLHADGRVYSSSGEAYAPLASYHFSDLINVPLYDAFEVVP